MSSGVSMTDPEMQKVSEAEGTIRRRPRAMSIPDYKTATMGRNESLSFSQHDVNYSRFAGRLGGNTLYTLSPDSPEYQETKQRFPDAVATASWREIMDLRGFKERRLWEMALIECLGVLFQVWSSGTFGRFIVTLSPAFASGPLVPICVACVVQFITITLFTFALGPVTGAHLNPLITMGTFVVRLSSFARTVLYVTFQCIGAIAGAWIFRGTLGLPKEDLVLMPGCYVDSSLVTAGQAFGLETTSAAFTLFLAFGLGLDPRNNGSFGPSVGPFLIGLSSALALFTTGLARPGYLGASNNPARCLGLNTASGHWTYHYNHWFADITAVIINGIGYELVPPFKKSNIPR